MIYRAVGTLLKIGDAGDGAFTPVGPRTIEPPAEDVREVFSLNMEPVTFSVRPTRSTRKRLRRARIQAKRIAKKYGIRPGALWWECFIGGRPNGERAAFACSSGILRIMRELQFNAALRCAIEGHRWHRIAGRCLCCGEPNPPSAFRNERRG